MTVQFDERHALDFLSGVYAGLGGFLQVCSTDNWAGRCYPATEVGLNAAVAYARCLDNDQQPKGVYFRATTVRNVLPRGKRGGAADTLTVPLFWADVDYGQDGHKGANLPPDAETAAEMIRVSGLPEPTLLVRSGGGLYPLWVLSEPLADTEMAAELSEGIQHALSAAHKQRGYAYGCGVGDLARVLRLPGSVNRKTDQPRPCFACDASGNRYAPEAFPTYQPPKPVARPAPRDGLGTGGRPSSGVFDVLDGLTPWADILEPADWTYVGSDSAGELWMRPGGSDSAYSARCFEHNMVCHSETAGLPSGSGQRLTKARVFAWLWHGGDLSAAARDLIAAAVGEPCSKGATALPRRVLEAVRPVVVRRATTSTAMDESATPDRQPSGTAEDVATEEELESWLASFTANRNPARLHRRLAWMRADGPRRLAHHTAALVTESIAGNYPAEHAVRALAAAYQHHSGADPDRPRRLLAAALGAVLAAKVRAA